VTGKFRSASRVRKLVRGISTWLPTSSPGREVAEVPQPVAFVRPLAQYAVRTPSKDHQGGYYHAVVFTSRTDLTMTGVVEHYDGRAGMEADLKSDKHGLGLAVIHKRLLPAQMLVVLLVELAHNILIWARSWLGEHAPCLRGYRIVRLIGQVWAIPGRVKLTEQEGVVRVRLRRQHPRAREVCQGFLPLFPQRQSMVVLGQIRRGDFLGESLAAGQKCTALGIKCGDSITLNQFSTQS
jgi:hypothetical protein